MFLSQHYSVHGSNLGISYESINVNLFTNPIMQINERNALLFSFTLLGMMDWAIYRKMQYSILHIVALVIINKLTLLVGWCNLWFGWGVLWIVQTERLLYSNVKLTIFLKVHQTTHFQNYPYFDSKIPESIIYWSKNHFDTNCHVAL